MKVCVFGAGGQTGKLVVQELLKRSHDVIAFVYGQSGKNNLQYIRGNILNYNDVSKAIDGADAVISVIGHVKGSDPRLQSRGISNVIRAMNTRGIKRIISLTGTGVRQAEDKPSLIDKILNFFISKIDPARIADGVEHAKILQSSNLDWTIVRVLKLTNSESDYKNYKLSNSGPAELFTSRKKVAYILCDILEDKEYNNSMPIIS